MCVHLISRSFSAPRRPWLPLPGTAPAVETHPDHTPGTIPERGPFLVDKVRKAYGESPGGNAVVLEDQTLKIAESRSQYELAATLLQKNLRMLRVAIGKNGG